jgi:alkylhydroperoxidase family enzyme
MFRAVGIFSFVLSSWATCNPAFAFQGDSPAVADNGPKPIPKFRDEMKAALERLKSRQPRLPWPETDAGRGGVNNGNYRAFYLPAEWQQQRPPRGTESQRGISPRTEASGQLDNAFKVRLFWIVSRVNNCHYCLGHQELKLINEGMLEDEIAELDCNWQAFPIAEQAAFSYVQKLTSTPFLVTDEDFNRLRQFFSDDQILDMLQTVAGYNSTNRWTDALGLPQDQAFRDKPADFSAPTSNRFLEERSKVALSTEPEWPIPKSKHELKGLLAEAGERRPRLDLCDFAKLDEEMQDLANHSGMRNYARIFGNSPELAKRQLRTIDSIKKIGRLPDKNKIQIFWAVSRTHEGLYTMHLTQKWLDESGLPNLDPFDWDQPQTNDPTSQLVLDFARKLTAHPRQISDEDIAKLREKFSDHEVAEIVHLAAFATMLNLFAEALNLPAETN